MHWGYFMAFYGMDEKTDADIAVEEFKALRI